MKELEGKVAFITGASSGIGLGISKALSDAGAAIVLGYRQERRLAEALEALAAAPNIHPVRLDVTDRAGFQRAADEAEARFGKVHILVNCAGVNLFGPMDLATHDDWDWVIGVNLGGAINSLIAVLPRIKAHGEGGYVVNVASMASFLPGAEAGIYTTSKFALRGLTECLRLTLAAHGIGVSLACPALTRTNIHESGHGRPAALAETAYPDTQAGTDRVRAILDLGADPFDVGARIVEGMLASEPYIFTHAGFHDELRADFEEILAAMPKSPPDPRHVAIEAARLERKAAGKRQAGAIHLAPAEPILRTASKS